MPDRSPRKLRAAVIGAGWYAAQNHIPALAARREVVLDGVCRLGVAELERVREHFGFAFAALDHRAVLAREPDLVVVASPHHMHYEHARAALDIGAHVLCEKPMTLDPAEAFDLVARARQRGRHLLIANSFHYAPRLGEVRDLLAQGIVGRIEHVMASFLSATRPVFEGAVGFRRWETSFFRPDRATWQSPGQGGGFAYGQLSHAIPLTLWLTGLDALEVSARTLDKGGIDICDAATVLCAGGAVVSLSGAPAMPEGRRALMRIFVAGSEGLATIELDRDRCEVLRDDGREMLIEVALGGWSPRGAGPPDALVDLALGRGENLSPGWLGAQTVAIIDALLRSAPDGRPQAVHRPKVHE